MKAAILEKYDKKNIDIKVLDLDVPEINDDEILVHIKYAGVNPLDNMIIHGEVKLITPYKVPLVMGNEFSGIVEKTGKNVKNFEVGDRVYARMPLDKIGAFAEYVSINKDALAKIPDYLSFKQAACIPLTALTAIQSYELMDIQPNEKIFISGGTGSLWAMAIPIAKSLGLHIITSGSSRNQQRVCQLGVDEFFDYKTQDYSNILKDIDYVLDTLGEKEIQKEFKILKSGGKLVSLKGMPNKEFAERMGLSTFKKILFKFAGMKFDKMAKKNNQKYYFLFVESNGNQLNQISKIFDENKIQPSIDEIYELKDVNEALKKVANGSSKGKTLLKIS